MSEPVRRRSSGRRPILRLCSDGYIDVGGILKLSPTSALALGQALIALAQPRISTL